MMQYNSLLMNIYAYGRNGPNLTFPTFKMTFWIIQSNQIQADQYYQQEAVYHVYKKK